MVVKNLKVIQSTRLNQDGTFQIGLRDPLLINKNSKITLDKFVYKQRSGNAVDYAPSVVQLYMFNPDTLGTIGKSLPVKDRVVDFPAGKYKSANQVLKALQDGMIRTLQTGDKEAPNSISTTLTDYFTQIPTNPTNDGGLEIEGSVDSKTGNVFLDFTQYPMRLIDQNNIIDNIFIEDLGGVETYQLVDDLEYFWMACEHQIVKSAFQMQVTIEQVGLPAYAFFIGLRKASDPIVDNTSNIDIGFLFHNEKITFYDGTATPVEIDASVKLEAGDAVVMYVQNSLVYIDIITIATNMVKESKQITSFGIGDSSIPYKAVICSAPEQQGTIGQAGDAPIFSNFALTYKDDEDLSTKRKIEVNFSESSTLANQLGFPSTDLIGDHSTKTTFFGTSAPSFFQLQDVSIYWSLPMQTFVASGDRKRNAKEQLISCFTPTRSVDRYDNLSYNSSLPYVSIGNNEQINISSLNFRIMNEYTSKPLQSEYLSFNLIIKDENE